MTNQQKRRQALRDRRAAKSTTAFVTISLNLPVRVARMVNAITKSTHVAQVDVIAVLLAASLLPHKEYE